MVVYCHRNQIFHIVTNTESFFFFFPEIYKLLHLEILTNSLVTGQNTIWMLLPHIAFGKHSIFYNTQRKDKVSNETLPYNHTTQLHEVTKWHFNPLTLGIKCGITYNCSTGSVLPGLV